MYNYKIKIQYDGTDYNGWQKQVSKSNTIQWRFERIVSELNGYDTQVIGSGRTDAGVHAKCQIANFLLKQKFEEIYLKNYINKYLPSDIAVNDVSIVPEKFHSRFDAKSKTYMYRVLNDIESNVFENRFVYKCTDNIDINQMRIAANTFTGEHDFMAFCSNKRIKKSTIRNVYSVEINKVKNEIQIIFCANGFLYNMARIMAGTILQCGIGEFDCNNIDAVFKSRNREMAGVTLPAKGLTLINVEY